METKKHMFHWCRVPLGGMALPRVSTRGRKTLLLSLLLTMMLAFGQTAKAAINFGDYSWISKQPSMDSPWIELHLSFYSEWGSDSFFTHGKADGVHDGPALYFDGEYVCSPDGPLAWPGSDQTGNNSDLNKERQKYNGWWRDTYNYTTPSGKSYTVKFYDPAWDGNNGVYCVTVVIYPWIMEIEKSHNISIKGYWKTNGSGTAWVDKTWTSSAASAPFSTPTAKMKDYSNFYLSGGLSSSYGPTTVGTTSNANGNSYIAAGSLTSKQEYAKGNTSYSNLSIAIGRSDFYNRVTKPVEYIVKKSVQDRGDFYIYKWFNVSVPGFVRAKDLNVEPDLFWKKITVKWDSDESDDRCKEGKWRVYRRLKDDTQWKLLTSTDLAYSQRQYEDDDAALAYDKEYEYKVVFIPTNSPAGTERSELSQTVEGKLERLASIFSDLKTTNDLEDKIVFSWSHVGFENASSHPYTIYVERSTNDITWEEVKTFSITSKSTTTGSFEDTQGLQAFQAYRYRLKVTVFDKDYVTQPVTGRLAGMSYVTELSATRGTYSNMVKLKIGVKQIGSTLTYLDIQRRPLGSVDPDDWMTLTTLSGTASSYSYDDVTALPGSYNEYQVLPWTMYNNNREENTAVQADGFSVSTGVISGRISYGTGTAVEGARVTLHQNNADGQTINVMRSLKFSGTKSGITYNTTAKGLKKLFGKDFSVQLYVSPSLNEMGEDGKTYTLFDVDGLFSITMKYDQSKKQYLLGTKVGSTAKATTLAIPRGEWRQVTCVYSAAAGTTTFYVAKDGELQKAVALSGTKLPSIEGGDKDAVKVNLAYLDDAEQPTYKGYVDEFRFFTRALSEKDILRNYNHPLSGAESDLAIYWPMDEGIEGQTIAYDFSKTNNIGNGRHGVTTVPATSDTYVPKDEELSLMAYTNEQGTFEVRGVPFSGEGTSYTITPTLGIHEFKPAYQSRYVNMSMLNHSAVDFEDISSFPVSGTIYYAGTDYPVEGVNFYVDGVICSKDGEPIVTDEKGTYTISVPIGDHVITVAKSGHVFAKNGRYPADDNATGEKHTFDQIIADLEFYDETLVNFTGRIVGGSIEGNKPVGFGQSVNNIGVTEFILTPLNETPRMNVVKKVTETSYRYDTNTATVPIESATTAINSEAWRGAGADDCKKFFIRTDAETGEFSAMVPPLQYKVSDMKVVKSGLKVGESTTIDLTNPNITLSDTLYNEDGTAYELYEYNTLLRQNYHSTPSFTVKQEGREDGSFGIDSYKLTDDDGELTISDIYSVTNGKVTYKYGGPLFIKGDPYTFEIEGFEEYTNADNGQKSHVALEGNVVTINNALSAEQSVYVEAGTVDGKAVKAGDVVELKENQLQLDSLGKAKYVWQAGLPNVARPYTRTISIDYDIDGRIYPWEGSGMAGIILGDLPTGNNFVTSGPDKLLMVLRDPPGTGSSATWTSGTVITKTEMRGSYMNESASAKFQHKFGVHTETIIGTPGAGNVIVAESKDDLSAGIKIEASAESSTTKTYETTVTTEISTSSEPDFVGDQGDVYIGTATNILFGKARNVGFKRDGESVSLGLADMITTGLQFGTSFNYTRSYIENVLFPNWQSMLERLLKTKKSQAEIDSYVNNTENVVYLTTLKSDDPNFGEKDTYTAIAPKTLKDGALYEDSVIWITTQIKNWKTYIEQNEMEKVKAYQNRDRYLKKNYSFDGGSSVTYTEECDTTTSHSYEWTCGAGVVAENTTGFEASGFGFEIALEDETVGGKHDSDDKDTLRISSFSYTLAEEGSDAISVDIYKYGQFSPIFRTRGGQTSNPYEGEVRTSYYKEGESYPIIMEATMQIEVPQIDVDVPTVSDVPTGSAANYTLQLGNASEVGADVAYKLFVLDETNPNGAQLSIDGKVLTEGRLIKVPGNQTLEKALQLRQTNTSVLDYEDIGIVFASDSQPEDIADTIFISAHFVPSSSDVMLALSNTTMNTQTGEDLVLTFSNFDRNYKNLKAFRLQYKKQGATDWTLLKEYVLDKKNKTNNNEMLPTTGASVSYTLPMASYSDGDYTFRVVSVATYGADEVYRYSDEIDLVKDMMRPRPMGQPEPSDGILDFGEDLSVTFNETILKGELTKTANFLVTGVLNGAEIDHETALSMQNTEATATTDASINLNKKDFSIDAWVNISGAGTLLSHGQGDQKITIGTNASSKLVVNIAGTDYTSTKTMPKNKWAFLSLSISNPNDATTKLNACVADDASETTLFKNQAVKTYEGNGPLSIGKKMKGAIHELLLWDEAHDMSTALLNRSRSKVPSTRHLIGYWKMNEGEGKEIRDYARNRHMTMADETWYINNENKAVSLDGQHYVSINTGALNTFASDDSAIEFWMRGKKQSSEAQLIQMGDVALWTNAQGELQLTTNGAFKPAEQMETYTTTSGNILDNAWHHIALNILRQGAAAVYVDGERCLTVDGANVGTIATDHLLVGAKRTTFSATDNDYSYDRAFKGQVDEVRVWNATLNADLLAKNRKVRLTGNEAGLVAYYPFEKKQLDSGNQVQTVGNDADLAGSSNKAQLLALNSTAATLSYVDDAPALRTKPTETNVSFTFVASDNKVVINIDEDPATIEGCTLNLTVRDLRDENGNYSEAATQEVKDKSEITATVVNKGGKQQMWTLSGMPSWLTADANYGTTNPLEETNVTFTVSPATPIGKYEETIYLKGNDGIEVPLTLNVKVTGQVPDWSVNPRDFENSMNVIGRVELDGTPMNDEDDLVGAFIGEECRGVAHLGYKERYDGYYVTMDIYGNENNENQAVTFRVYDASTGTLYPAVQPSSAIKFEPLALIGEYSAPVVLTVLDKIEQSIDLKAGWNWISLNVQADDMTVSSVFDKIADDVYIIKSQTSWLMREEGEWNGTLTDALSNTQMYAVKLFNDCNLRLVGKRVNPATTPITLKKGWNWIGYYGRQVTSVADAMAGMQPEDGDIVKGQTGVAYFDDYEWAGSLSILEPGKGYMVKSTTTTDLSFSYPTASVAGAPARQAAGWVADTDDAASDDLAQTNRFFAPVNFHNYSSNAIMTAQVMMGGKPVANAEIGVFANGECRAAAITDERGIAYLTILGDEVETLTFRVLSENAQVEASETLTYEQDAVYGSPKRPFIIDLSAATGIGEIATNAEEKSVYDLQGRKLTPQLSRQNKGIYIVNGKKQVVK